MNRDKQLRRAVKALSKLADPGITVEKHCSATCWKVHKYGSHLGYVFVGLGGDVKVSLNS